jgi:hypothetical protein
MARFHCSGAQGLCERRGLKSHANRLASFGKRAHYPNVPVHHRSGASSRTISIELFLSRIGSLPQLQNKLRPGGYNDIGSLS